MRFTGSNTGSKLITNAISWLKEVRIDRIFSIVLAGFLLLSSNIAYAQNDQSLGERMRERIQQTDQNSERPKTMGEWQDEVEGDVPLNERVYNTVRDSAEAFNQFGKEYSVGAQESARSIKDKAADATQDVSSRVQ